jgi:epoxide hydrolase 4
VIHQYADNNGVQIHYTSIGNGPLVVMIHGFPDFWYTWRNQMVALAPHFQVVALDLRGYNLSDRPFGREHYSMHHLVEDVHHQTVIRHIGRDKAIIVGHDWGGAISWMFAIGLPAMTQRLIILNSPHPVALPVNWHITHNSNNRVPTLAISNKRVHISGLLQNHSAWVKNSNAQERYLEAFRRSDFEVMLHYYKQNYPHQPYQDIHVPLKVQAPVLHIHGLQDEFLLPGVLNNTWEWLENDWTILAIRQAGHFVQHDAADVVTRNIISWLTG